MRESLLVIDKTPGPSSFDIVRQVKRLFGGEKVGHTGSLDPFASGVLVCLVGRATKLSNVLLNADKRYRAVVKLGESTDTMDLTGTVRETAPVPELSLESIDRVVKDFEGTWNQTPPMFSAKKVKGVRLYQLARQNIHIPREPIPVDLYEMKTLAYEAPFLHFEVHCSKGTYIRSLADELGRRLGTVGHLHELRRLACGGFSLEEAVTVEKLAENLTPWLGRGYQNYVKLLRSEGILRKTIPSPRRAAELQMPSKSGNSLLN